MSLRSRTSRASPTWPWSWRSNRHGRLEVVGGPVLDPRKDVAYLDAKVLAVVKGTETRKVVRIWDAMFGTSCTQSLEQYVPGSILAVATRRKSSDPLLPVWSARKPRPGTDDYLDYPCARNIERPAEHESAAAFAQRLRDTLSQVPR